MKAKLLSQYSKLLASLTLVLLSLSSCMVPVEESQEIMVYPNPYDPRKGFLKIKDANNSSLAPSGGEVKLIVYDLNLIEVYRGMLIADEYAGIDHWGNPLSPGIYFLKIVVIDGTTEKVKSERYRLIVQ